MKEEMKKKKIRQNEPRGVPGVSSSNTIYYYTLVCIYEGFLYYAKRVIFLENNIIIQKRVFTSVGIILTIVWYIIVSFLNESQLE